MCSLSIILLLQNLCLRTDDVSMNHLEIITKEKQQDWPKESCELSQLSHHPVPPIFFWFSLLNIEHTNSREEKGGRERERERKREKVGGTVGEVLLDPNLLEQLLIRDRKFWSYNCNRTSMRN